MPDDDRVFVLTQHFPEGFSAGTRVFCCPTCSAMVLNLEKHQKGHLAFDEVVAVLREYGRMLFPDIPREDPLLVTDNPHLDRVYRQRLIELDPNIPPDMAHG